MPDMGKHANSTSGLRRARAAAWIVFLSMAGTTMTFQVYHSIKVGQMPWPLAVLYGTVPLLIAICILEVVAEWHDSPAWAKTAAYAIMGGSMFMSASATGNVVLHAAAPHWSLLFGFLLDAAALLTVHFLLNGPRPLTKAQEAEVSAHRAALEAERSATQAMRAAAEAERSARAEAEAVLASVRGELAGAVARAEAEAGRAETLARKLAGNGTRKGTGNPGRKPAGNAAGATARSRPDATAPEGTPEDSADLDAEALVLKYLAEGLSASAAGLKAGLSDSRGRQIARKLAKAAPRGVDSDGGEG